MNAATKFTTGIANISFSSYSMHRYLFLLTVIPVDALECSRVTQYDLLFLNSMASHLINHQKVAKSAAKRLVSRLRSCSRAGR